MSHVPAAKCNGVLFLPSKSLAFTSSGVDRRVWTVSRSPFLHASNRDGPKSAARTEDRLREDTGEEMGDETDELLILKISTFFTRECCYVFSTDQLPN